MQLQLPMTHVLCSVLWDPLCASLSTDSPHITESLTNDVQLEIHLSHFHLVLTLFQVYILPLHITDDSLYPINVLQQDSGLCQEHVRGGILHLFGTACCVPLLANLPGLLFCRSPSPHQWTPANLQKGVVGEIEETQDGVQETSNDHDQEMALCWVILHERVEGQEGCL